MKLKTIEDLKYMHAQEMQVFSSEYTYYLRELKHYILNKSDGYELVKKELEGFDEEAQEKIILDLSRVGIIVEKP